MRRLELTPTRHVRHDVHSIWALDGRSTVSRDAVILPDPYRELVLVALGPLLLARDPGTRRGGGAAGTAQA